MQSGNPTVVAEVWMLLCTILIRHVEASISRVLATSTINQRHWGLSFKEHKRTMGRIKKSDRYLNYMNVINPWENKNWIPLAIFMLYYWLAWLNASVFCVSKKGPSEFLLFTRDDGFQQDSSFNLRERRAQTLDQFDSRYEFAEFSVRIYYDTFSFQSADRYSGTYVDAEASLFRTRSQSTCLHVEFRSWA